MEWLTTDRPIRYLQVLGSTCLVWSGGCAVSLETAPQVGGSSTSLVICRMLTVLTERPGRMYDPTLRFFEVRHRTTGERYRVEVNADDELVTVNLPAGAYELTRVQISEGPFLSMAEPDMRFQVARDKPTYLGTWRLGVESPRYGRMLVVSTVQDVADRQESLRQLAADYPELSPLPPEISDVVPRETQARLYEVMPYPRYPSYFRRHLW